jgi:PhzF family phenazine biosynthesis protein
VTSKIAVPELFVVDAFASAPFTGNPAAVCLLDAAADAPWMQALAAEMNLSETAFPRRRADGDWNLRWFSPTTEVELCGHATLATAHVLWETARVGRGTAVRFHTLSGLLSAAPRDDLIEIDLPTDPIRPVDIPEDLVAALGATPRVVRRGRIGWFAELDDEDAVRALRPDFRALEPFGSAVVTAAASNSDFDFVSRYFLPGYGIDEDPVTGSAHCALGPYWAERLGRDELVGHQVSARGGVVAVRVVGDRTVLGGRAVTVLAGSLSA